MPPDSPVKFDHDGLAEQVGVNPAPPPPPPQLLNEIMGQNEGASGNGNAGHGGPVLFVDSDQVSPGLSECCWVGAEVLVENKISRRCSYEEMVHEEVLLPAVTSSSVTSTASLEDQWYLGVTRVTQWAIILQEVYEERAGQQAGPSFSSLSSKCLCHKASTISQKLARLENMMLEQHERQASDDLDDIVQTVDDVQSALRAGVSIQISKPSEAVISKAASIVETAMVSCERALYLRSAIDSIVKLVNNLLNVPTCGHASNGNLLDDSDRIRDVSPTRLMEQDEEEDIRSRVASMFKDEDDDDEEEEGDDDDAMDTGSSTPRITRKRKQLFLKTGKNVTSPTASPSKRPRKLKSPVPSYQTSMSAPPKICQSSPALDLLENKKKVQRNSLYHWVLWREALRGEKDRVSGPGSPHPPRRLSFN